MCESPEYPAVDLMHDARALQRRAAAGAAAAHWQAEVGRLTDYLLLRFPAQAACGHAQGETAVETAMRLLEEGRSGDPGRAIWGQELARLTVYLLDHHAGEIGCGYPRGEGAVDTAIRLIERRPGRPDGPLTAQAPA